MSLRGRVKKLEAALAELRLIDADALRFWRLAVEWTEWAHRVHGGRDAALASGDSPPDPARFSAFSWGLMFLTPLVPEDCRVGNWRSVFSCALAVVLDALIEGGATQADLQGPDALAEDIAWCAELMRQVLPVGSSNDD